MEPGRFVAEVYRRMSALHAATPHSTEPPEDFWTGKESLREHLEINYRPLLPARRESTILDLGCGQGHFAAACVAWGYSDVVAADYSDHAAHLKELGVREFIQVHSDIPETLRDRVACFDVIHAAHLIEHVPKHDLLDNVDAMFYALRPRGLLLLETPNMLSPTAMHSLFVTLGHEYGFGESNLTSLLTLCGFDDVHVLPVRSPNSHMKWKLANVLRSCYLSVRRRRDRLFGMSTRQLTTSILAVGVRPPIDPLPIRSP